MELKVLGPMQMVEGGQPLPVGGIKQRTVLALLIAAGGRPVSTDALVYGVYGDAAPDGARRSIQTYVSTLRRQLGDHLGPTGSGYELAIDRSAVDAHAFEDAVRGNGDAADPGTRSEDLRRALETWRGLAYADVDAYDVIPGEVSRLSELRLIAVESLIDADLAMGRHTELVSELERLTAEHPHRERFRGQQMLALYRSGRQADALRAFEEARSYLVEEMGLDPSVELRTLERQILDHDPVLGHGPQQTLRRATVLVADLADPATLAELDPADRARSLDLTSAVLTQAIAEQGGEVFAQRGTATYSWFETASDAVESAGNAQWKLNETTGEALHMRMAVDTGDVEMSGSGQVQGPPVSRAAALLAVARGGQVLIAAGTQRDLVEVGGGWEIRGLGTPEIAGIEDGQPIHQLRGAWPGGRDSRLREHGLVPAPPDRRASLPGYESREVVGSGQFGVVFRAYQPSVGREVAIKEIRPDLVDHPLFIRRFEVEAQLVARLEHPHIVPLHDFWRDSTGAFLVTRWMQGGSLRDRLVPGGLSETEISQMVAQIGAALAAAHRGGVTHRDIGPGNILFDADGNAYLADFAIASVDLPDGSQAIDVAAFAKTILDCFVKAVIPLDHDGGHLLEAASAGSMEIAQFLAEWDRRFGGTALAAARLTEARNPYKGLDAFGEHDQDDFHGREALVDHLVDAVRGRQLVGVTGPSGIGKSSVVRAGLVPALRSGAIGSGDRWLIADMVPGAHPFEQLASALERVAIRAPVDFEEQLRRDKRALLRATQRYLPQENHLLLIVDQFEELFTYTDDEVRSAFLALLAETATDPNSRVHIVLTLRADFFDHPLRNPEFGELLRLGTVPVSAPTNAELRSIIELPAEGVGVSYTNGLVDRIVDEVSGQPGTLPLLEFALMRLFDRRTTDEIPAGDYQRLGGVLSALGQQAEQVYVGLDGNQREIARQVFMRLVNVTEGGHVTRRRARRAEVARLGYSPAELAGVVDVLVDARLLTSDRDAVTRVPTLEVAHEALLGEWQRLEGWIKERQEDLLLHTRLGAAVADWEANDCSEAYLLKGGRLEQHEAWTVHTDLTLTTNESEFLRRSREAEQTQASQRRTVRRRVLAGFAAASVFASILAVVAVIARNNATEQANAAESERLLANSAAVLDDDPQLALLLALAGVGDDVPEALELGLLRDIMSTNRGVATHHWADRTVGQARAVLSPDSSMIAASADPAARVVMMDAVTGVELWSFRLPAGVEDLDMSPRFISGGTELLVSVDQPKSAGAALRSDLGLYVLDAASGEELRHWPLSECGVELSPASEGENAALVRILSPEHVREFGCGPPDGGFVPYDIEVIDLQTGSKSPLVRGEPGVFDSFVSALNREGSVAALLLDPGDVRVFDVATGDVINEYLSTSVSSIALSADAGMIALGGAAGPNRGAMYVYDLVSNDLISTVSGHNGATRFSVFSEGGSQLITAGTDGVIRVWWTADGSVVSEIRVGSAPKNSVSLSSVGRLVVAGAGPEVHVVSMDPADAADLGSIETCDQPGAFHQSYSMRVRGDLATVGVQCGADGTLIPRVFNVETGEWAGQGTPTFGQGMDLSPDGHRIAAQQGRVEGESILFGSIEIADLRTGEATLMEGLCDYDFQTVNETTCSPFPGLPFALANSRVLFSPDGTLVGAVEAWRGIGAIWDIDSRLPIHFFEATDFSFSPDSKSVVTVSGRQIELADVRSGDVLASRLLESNDGGLFNLEFTPDGVYLIGSAVLGRVGGDLVVLNAATLEEVSRIVAPHSGAVKDIAVSSDGAFIATAAADGFVTVWDLSTAKPTVSIAVDLTDTVQAVSFSSDDSRLLVVPRLGPVLVYSLDPMEVVEFARSRLLRGFSPTECATYFDDGACPDLNLMLSGAGSG